MKNQYNSKIFVHTADFARWIYAIMEIMIELMFMKFLRLAVSDLAGAMYKMDITLVIFFLVVFALVILYFTKIRFFMKDCFPEKVNKSTRDIC